MNKTSFFCCLCYHIGTREKEKSRLFKLKGKIVRHSDVCVNCGTFHYSNACFRISLIKSACFYKFLKQ
ncbi:unnamed protein product [Arabidopsis halleri]